MKTLHLIIYNCCQFIYFVFLISISTSSSAQNEEAPGFIGGMNYGPGRFLLTNPLYSGVSWGSNIGGRLSFSIYKNFRIGAGGGSLHASYINDSFFSFGHGFLLAEYFKNIKKLSLGTGIDVGGGKIYSLHIKNKFNNSIDGEIFEQGYKFYAPYLFVFYNVSDKLAIGFLGDYMLPFSGNKLGITGANYRICLHFKR
jgi:hypothetical protein